MEKKILNEIERTRVLMGLNEIDPPSHISLSKDGTINFFDLNNKKVYKYKLVARALNKNIDIVVKSINFETGSITYVNPQSDEEKTEMIPKEVTEQILQKFRDKNNFESIHSFKTNGIKVSINLNFSEEFPLEKK